jgi:hypothetical protein
MRGAQKRGVTGRGTPGSSLAGRSVARLGGVCWAEALTCGLGSETGALPSSGKRTPARSQAVCAGVWRVAQL